MPINHLYLGEVALIFPSLDALHEHTRLLAELNWLRYCDSDTLLGTAMPE